MNKVQTIRAVDTQPYKQWALNALFAAYPWNGSPVDGTDIIRSFTAKARTFHFPLDVQNSDEVARIPQQGEATIQHVTTMFTLWFQQKELLKVLNDEQRNLHREMANQNKRKRMFQPGDLVIIRKQVTSSAEEGKPAKLTLRSKGPYRVLEEAGDNSYFIQKIPVMQSLTKRPGKRMTRKSEQNSEDETETEEDEDGRDNETQPEEGKETRGNNAQEAKEEAEATEPRNTRNTSHDGSKVKHIGRKRSKRKQNETRDIHTPEKRVK
jgi:hypothetical protein